jgi:hypothetical protein
MNETDSEILKMRSLAIREAMETGVAARDDGRTDFLA